MNTGTGTLLHSLHLSQGTHTHTTTRIRKCKVVVVTGSTERGIAGHDHDVKEVLETMWVLMQIETTTMEGWRSCDSLVVIGKTKNSGTPLRAVTVQTGILQKAVSHLLLTISCLIQTLLTLGMPVPKHLWKMVKYYVFDNCGHCIVYLIKNKKSDKYCFFLDNMAGFFMFSHFASLFVMKWDVSHMYELHI